jgi:hypothetical protein
MTWLGSNTLGSSEYIPLLLVLPSLGSISSAGVLLI